MLGEIFVIISIIFSCLCLTVNPTAASSRRPTPDEAIELLKAGNERFATGMPQHPRQDSARVKLANAEDQGDHAYATVITCSDSRMPVEILFDAGIMDIFVIRVAGNVVDRDEAGTIEYGLVYVHTPVLVVLGHTKCGAITTVTRRVHGDAPPLERNIPFVIDKIVPAVKTATTNHPDVHGDDLIPYAIEENIWQAVKSLFMMSPVIRNMVQAGQVKVVGAIYDMENGKVNWLPEEKSKSILDQVNQDPGRATNAMAESG